MLFALGHGEGRSKTKESIMRTDKSRRLFCCFVGCCLAFPAAVQAQQLNNPSGKPTTEPVLRVSKKPAATSVATATPHPLDPALQLAHDGLTNMRENIQDYTATLVKRERINGRLGQEEYLAVKIRNERRHPQQGNVPFSIYMRFLKPESFAGREVIWVKGKNDDKLVAHDTGFIRGSIRVNLDPLGGLAMKGNRYPIYDAGLENLVTKLIEKAERDRAAGHCDVNFFKSKVAGRDCTMIKVTHDEKKAPYDFHIAKVYIDDELQIPIRYAAYSWPRRPGAEPPLEEEYTYLDVKLNVGLSDRDFDPNNPEYAFP